MGKKKGAAAAASKAAAKAAKKVKAAKKEEKRDKKMHAGNDSDADSDDDLEAILNKIQHEWEVAHRVTEETVEGPPSRRANATLTPCPSGNHLWCIGGEFFSEDGKAHFYNDVYRYGPDKDEWRRFTSPTCPGPRSAHAVVATSAGGGKLFLFGGEFSSLHQTTFHHYRDFWCFDITSRTWERIETKVKPSARSGCRMALWKNLIVLFGGFYDPGIRTNYLNDLWIFDIQEYAWKQVEFKENDRKPSPRSGFSFIPVPEGVILHGGYCKEYVKGKRPVGIALQDTWLLQMNVDFKQIKWEGRKKKTGYAPSLRSGCTMAVWQTKNMGIMFGGVYDEDKGEEGLESVFYNDLYGYQTTGNGRWVSLTLRRPKKPKATAQKKKQVQTAAVISSPKYHELSDEDTDHHHNVDDIAHEDTSDSQPVTPVQRPHFPSPMPVAIHSSIDDTDIDPSDPTLTIPLVRYNAMLAVLRDTLYIYGGIYESRSREYTLDDFHALNLNRMDRYMCLKKSEAVIEDDDESSEDDEDDDDEEEEEEDGEEDGEEEVQRTPHPDAEDEDEDAVTGTLRTDDKKPSTEEENKDLRNMATAFMGISKDANRAEEDAISTPLPGETLALFYARSREFWAQMALKNSDNRGKMLRRDGFSLAEERYESYKPVLKEVQKILAEAGLDEEEMRRMSAGKGDPKGEIGGRNRR